MLTTYPNVHVDLAARFQQIHMMDRSKLREFIIRFQNRILFGTDYPFAPEGVMGKTIRGLEDHGGFDASERTAIERDNAIRLFPRLAEAVQ